MRLNLIFFCLIGFLSSRAFGQSNTFEINLNTDGSYKVLAKQEYQSMPVEFIFNQGFFNTNLQIAITEDMVDQKIIKTSATTFQIISTLEKFNIKGTVISRCVREQIKDGSKITCKVDPRKPIIESRTIYTCVKNQESTFCTIEGFGRNDDFKPFRHKSRLALTGGNFVVESAWKTKYFLEQYAIHKKTPKYFSDINTEVDNDAFYEQNIKDLWDQTFKTYFVKSNVLSMDKLSQNLVLTSSPKGLVISK